MEEAFIVDIVVEIHIDLRGLVSEQEPADLGDRESIRLSVNKDGSDAQTCLQKTFHGIFRKACRLGYLFLCQSIAVITQKREDSVSHQQAGRLEDYRPECYELGHPLGLPGGVLVFRVPFFEFGKQFHLLKV